ncbi:helix-turn-helix domain-containing protein [Sphaerotilus microaerophilus]|uniref:Transcriptional regulator n=1 Tax=Sphaerotilus microaerophilus TaxID=2914710 RepID=A0ABM7YHM6_9BURK|nr:helix-turn-helix domain-containing protein [Sphaerotilus sp. FB-5]BDI03848.1 transcriptional regulator [Sphaerotilus sp. FB-5]
MPTLPDPGARPRRTPDRLPAFTLYGEVPSGPGALVLHIESIDSRSRLYDWEIDAHVHQGLHQVLWLRTGRVAAMLDETRISAQGPCALVIPPGVAHAFSFSPGSEGHVFTVNATRLAEGEAPGQGGVGEALQTLFARPRSLGPAPDGAEVGRLQALFEALLAEHLASDAGSPVPLWLARAVVWRLAQLALREDRDSAKGAQGGRRAASADRQSLYTRWVVLMESHYLEHWPVSRYAERLGLSTERLNRMVRAETGQNAQALLHARLAREACRRLVHVAVPVSRLGFELGFEDPAYFCRFFKRLTGLSPRAYRAAQGVG